MHPRIRPLDWKYLRAKACLLRPLLQALHRVPGQLLEQESGASFANAVLCIQATAACGAPCGCIFAAIDWSL